MTYMPFITETDNGTRTYDLPSYLHKQRTIFLNGPVDDHSAGVLAMQLLHLESESPDEDINLYINSPGGSVTAGMMAHDAMRKVRCKVNTICMGQACSMGAFLLTAGTGIRSATEYSRIMIHQPLGGYQGQATDIEIHTKEILKIRKTLNALMAKYTCNPIDMVDDSTDRDNFMSASGAKEFGLIDKVIKF